jgi:hypothetical protein
MGHKYARFHLIETLELNPEEVTIFIATAKHWKEEFCPNTNMSYAPMTSLDPVEVRYHTMRIDFDVNPLLIVNLEKKLKAALPDTSFRVMFGVNHIQMPVL